MRYRQRPDSLEYQLVRAKLRGMQTPSRDAVNTFEVQLKEKRFASEGSARYGLAIALAASREWKRADQELREARRLVGPHAMLETLSARIKVGQGQGTAAREQLAQAMKEYNGRPYVAYAYADVLQGLGQHTAAIDVLEPLSRARPRDGRVYSMLARSYAGLNKRALQHRNQAEYYVLEGALPAAIDQLDLARKGGDADFYTLSSIDARMRELRRMQEEERRRQ